MLHFRTSSTRPQQPSGPGWTEKPPANPTPRAARPTSPLPSAAADRWPPGEAKSSELPTSDAGEMPGGGEDAVEVGAETMAVPQTDVPTGMDKGEVDRIHPTPLPRPLQPSNFFFGKLQCNITSHKCIPFQPCRM